MIFKRFISILLLFCYDFLICFCYDQVNVGTVLFNDFDNTRKCWSNEELALLRSRMVFQDILPKTDSISMHNDAIVVSLIQYFRIAVEKTKKMTAGKVREINMKALTDTIGGYMHHLVLPQGKHAFYAGRICFETAEQLYELYDEMKSYLRTDGNSWAEPIRPTDRMRREADPLPNAPIEHEKHACSLLVFSKDNNGAGMIPMPFLDSSVNPSSIAVPFKDQPLRNIKSKRSAFVLVKYYETAYACMQEQGASQAQIEKFNQDLSKFINEQIMPHMNDEDLYPAFGSVYRLKETLNKGGLYGAGTFDQGSIHTEPPNNSTEEYINDEDKSTAIMFIAVAVVIIIWILTGVIYWCCRKRRKQKDYEKHVIDGNMLKKRTPSSRADSQKCKMEKRSDSFKHPTDDLKVRPDDPKKSSKSSQKSQRIKLPKNPPADRKSGGGIAKPPPPVQCPKCKRMKCGHGHSAHVAHTVATVNVREVKSAPLNRPFHPTKMDVSSSSNTSSAKKPIIYGYNIQTSSSESSFSEDSSSNSDDGQQKK